MRYGFGSKANRGYAWGTGRGRGGVCHHFAPVLILLILGGHGFRPHGITYNDLTSNASREGARYAAKYTLNGTDLTTDDIKNYIELPPPAPGGLNYNSFNLSNLYVSRTFDGNFPNKIVIVTVKADKDWWILGNLPGFTNPTRITATTAMNVEH